MVLFPHPAANRMWNWAEQEYLLFIHSDLILWSVSRFGTPRGFPRAEQEVDPSWHIEVRFPQFFWSVFSVILVLVKWWFIWCFCGLSNRSKWRPFLTPGPSSEATVTLSLFHLSVAGWAVHSSAPKKVVWIDTGKDVLVCLYTVEIWKMIQASGKLTWKYLLNSIICVLYHAVVPQSVDRSQRTSIHRRMYIQGISPQQDFWDILGDCH